jgi:hypothetical protein
MHTNHNVFAAIPHQGMASVLPRGLTRKIRDGPIGAVNHHFLEASFMNNIELIEAVHQHLKWPNYFPSMREHWRDKVRAAVAANAGSSEQKQALIALEKELSEPPPQEESFPGSCARSW